MKLSAFDKCVHELSKLPGIGKKTAARLSMSLLNMNNANAIAIANSIINLKENIIFCHICGSLTEINDERICEFCSSNNRDQSIICIVEEAKDIFQIEQTKRYYGLYHVLGGRISPLDGITPDKLRFEELYIRLAKPTVKEIIIATNPDIEGETTAIYLLKKVRNVNDNIKITRIASGIPAGGNLEYADDLSLLRAIEGRYSI